jgi:uncharacterized protein
MKSKIVSNHELFDEILKLSRQAEKNQGDWPVEKLKELALENHYAPAIYALATWYLFGRAMKKDIKEGIKLLKLAADEGFPPAQRDLAIAYENGSGITKNEKKAFLFYLRAANNYDLDAQTELARCFYFGIGTETDFDQAKQWYQIAAHRGDPDAQYGYGFMLVHGHGFSRANKKEAKRYFRMAETQRPRT